MTVEDQIRAGLDRANQALRDRGYPAANVSFVSNATHSNPCYACVNDLPVGVPSPSCAAKTFAEVIDDIIGKIGFLPQVWSDDQVAATLGIGVAA